MVFGWLACLAQTLLGSFLVEQSAMEQVLIHNEIKAAKLHYAVDAQMINHSTGKQM